MGQLSIGRTAADALRFSAAHYETALRVAWVPLLALLAWQGLAVPRAHELIGALPGGPLSRVLAEALFMLVPLGIVALYMAPLVLLAARGQTPSHRSVPVRPGAAEARWLLGSLLSIGGLFVLAKLPVGAALSGLSRLAAHVRTAREASFEPGSLHASEVVPAYSTGLGEWLSGEYVTLLDLGAGGRFGFWSGAPLIVTTLGFALLAYIWLRLLPLPAFMALGGGLRAIARGTRQASAGWNILRLLAILALVTAANVALVAVLTLVPMLMGAGLSAAYPVLSGISAFSTGGEVRPWVGSGLSAAALVFETVFAVCIATLGAALNAGMLGSVARQVSR